MLLIEPKEDLKVFLTKSYGAIVILYNNVHSLVARSVGCGGAGKGRTGREGGRCTKIRRLQVCPSSSAYGVPGTDNHPPTTARSEKRRRSKLASSAAAASDQHK